MNDDPAAVNSQDGQQGVPCSPRTGLPLIPKGRAERTARCANAAPAALRHGIAQFNAGAYWECHETLEELWRAEPDAVRYLYQGILLAGVGLYHLRRSNRRGALSKLRAAQLLLAPYVPMCMGVDVAALLEALSPLPARIEATPDDSDLAALEPAPRIRFVGAAPGRD